MSEFCDVRDFAASYRYSGNMVDMDAIIFPHRGLVG